MKRLIFLLLLTGLLAGAKERYSFRASEAYARLSTTDKERLEQVHRDLALDSITGYGFLYPKR